MRPSKRVAPEDSLSLATRHMRENGAGLLPIVDGEKFLGVMTELSLTQALAEGLDINEAVSKAMTPWPTVAPYCTGAEALRCLSELEMATLVVVDDDRRLMGLLSASDLVPRTRPPIRPNMVGGMASPFGVYLTTGTVSGGVSQWALMATGATMSLLLLAGGIATQSLAVAVGPHAPSWLTSAPAQWILMFFVFGLGMRLLPMAGIHAAEHQVVHAIERGEELRYDVVARMPRVHPRCGTNVATGLGIFLGVFGIAWIPDTEVRAILGAAAAYFLWRRVGGLMQYFVTTRPPSKKDIESGIRAGRQLLERYSKVNVIRPSVPRYIWSSGLLHVLAGTILCGAIVQFIGWVFHWDWLTLVN